MAPFWRGSCIYGTYGLSFPQSDATECCVGAWGCRNRRNTGPKSDFRRRFPAGLTKMTPDELTGFGNGMAKSWQGSEGLGGCSSSVLGEYAGQMMSEARRVLLKGGEGHDENVEAQSKVPDNYETIVRR